MCGAVMSAGYTLAADAKALYYMLGLSGRVREQVKIKAEQRLSLLLPLFLYSSPAYLTFTSLRCY